MKKNDENVMKEGHSAPLKRGTCSTYVTYDDATVNTCTTRGTLATFETTQFSPKAFTSSSKNSTETSSDDDMNSIAPCDDTQAPTEEQRRYVLEQKFKHQQHYTKDLLRSSSSLYNHQAIESETSNSPELGIKGDSYTDHEVTSPNEPSNPECVTTSNQEDDPLYDSVESPEQQTNQDDPVTENETKPFFTLLQMPQSSSTEMWKKAWDQDDDDDEDHDEDDDESDGKQEDMKAARRLDEELQLGVNGVEWERVSPLQTTLHVSEKRITRSCINANAVLNSHSAPYYEKPCLDDFEQLRVLGKGSFGKVVLVRKRTGVEKGGLFAMKRLRKTHLLKRGQIERTRTERLVLSMVDHPFIMKLHFAFQTEEMLFLILDYCAGGELFFHLCREKKFPEQWTRFYSAELLLALGHLHSKGIIYRDLKPENVLLDSEGHVKLGDFGLAKTHINHYYKGAKSRVGTPEYMAPEVLLQQGHGFCVDYWGLGMLTYEMMTGLPPWYTTDRHKLMKRLKGAPLDIPPGFSPHLANFTSSLLERDPRRRLGVRGIQYAINHEFFRRLDFRALQSRQLEAPIRPCEGWQPTGQQKKSKLRNMFYSPRAPNEILQTVSKEELERATSNFDQQFTRMALDSAASRDYSENDSDQNDEDSEELNEDTFVGFTFDDNSEGALKLHVM